jgi:hypothetical protein
MSILKLLAFISFIFFVILQIGNQQVDAWLPAVWSLAFVVGENN